MKNNRLAYMPLSEARVVRELILKRSEYDASYLPSLFQDHILDTDGVFPQDEDALCTYIDLDVQINTCGLSQTERKIVGYQMQGYGLSDVADYLGHTRQTSEILFDRAIEKIISMNNQNWENCHCNRPISQL